MKKLLLLLMVFVGHITYAQVLIGSVKDEKGQVIPGASIQNISSKSATVSDVWGNFSLRNTKINDSLLITFISFESQKIKVESLENLQIILKEKSFSLSEIVIKKAINAVQIISDINVESSPVGSSQDLLRAVPGLFIGQHAGGGKAEQIFLRGFDIDHGTDINISVDGLPVNMVSHAHGQGYADLHFVIPETVENVAFSKGSYMVEQGNFATAGSVGFQLKEQITENVLKLEYGQFNHKRLLGMLDFSPKNSKNTAYVASEYLYNDGPFEAPQALNRLNVFSKAVFNSVPNQKLVLSGSYFKSDWNASGQVPQRAINSGLIGRFGAIDNTEGGATSRVNATAVFDKSLSQNTTLHGMAFYSQYAFNLFSNFTFFANNPILGDQIQQKEKRNMGGFELGINKTISTNGGIETTLNLKIGLRADAVRNSLLARTHNKENLIENINFGDIAENNMYTQLNTEIKKGKWLIVPGLRLDKFDFDYNNLLEKNTEKLQKNTAFVSPKLSVIFQKNGNSQFYLKSGFGYHSNDARVIINQKSKYIVPRSLGADLGQLHKIHEKTVLNTSLWFLALQQEFVYVGDEGIVESAGATRRYGLDVSVRQEIKQRIFLDADLTYAHARSIEAPAGGNFIPLAPIFTFTMGATLQNYKGFSAGLKTRVLGKRPATEDYSLTAKGYVVTDANLTYSKKRYSLGIIVQNLFNTQWSETQFATTSRLQNEPEPINEIHFTPGTPFNMRTVLRVNF
jgi:TonB-dependent Receptor Plug Domain/CarboxypepD_reg-like domain